MRRATVVVDGSEVLGVGAADIFSSPSVDRVCAREGGGEAVGAILNIFSSSVLEVRQAGQWGGGEKCISLERETRK